LHLCISGSRLASIGRRRPDPEMPAMTAASVLSKAVSAISLLS
jgi:hypothetical protein